MEEFLISKGDDNNPKGNNSYRCDYESACISNFRSQQITII